MGRIWPDPKRPDEGWFLPEDTDAVLEWQREKDLACPGCGHPRDETMQKNHHDHYTASALRCHACAAKDRKREQFTKQAHDDAGLYFIAKELDD